MPTDNAIRTVHEPAEVSRAATTAFEADGNVTEAQVPEPSRLSRSYYVKSEYMTEQTIKSFLSKPQRIVSGSLSISDLASTFSPWAMPHTLLQSTVVREKVSGYYGIRGTMVFRLQVNATRFQQGRYMLSYVPMGGCAGASASAGGIWAAMHTNTTKARTQVPHVEIDINCDTEAILRVPFHSSMDFFPLQSTYDGSLYGAWGRVQIFPYQALKAVTGSTSCTYTLFGYLEDVELIGATVPIVAQSGRMFGSDKEAKDKDVGPIESTAIKISKALTPFTTIPLLSNYTTPVKWVSDQVSHVASVFGWSAPVNLQPVHRMQRTLAGYSHNVDKVDQSLPLSLVADNKVSVMPGFSGSDTDELSIPRFASIKSWFASSTWDINTAINFQLASIPLNPRAGNSTRSYLSQTVLDLTPIGYLGTKFAYYRGSIQITMKIVKTEFHSGRLSVVFFPSDFKSPNNGTIAGNAIDFLHRDIVDIRETNEMTFSFPYIAPTPYLPVNRPYGFMNVYVLDALVAPATVSSSIDILFEIAGGPDIEFAVMNNIAMAPAQFITAQSGNMFGKDPCALVVKSIGGTTTGKEQVATSVASIGEKIVSLRSLLKRFYTVREGSTYSNGVPGKYLNILPFAYQASDYPPSADSQPALYNDLYGELCSIFLYSRGGVRLKVVPTQYSSANLANAIPDGVVAASLVNADIANMTQGSIMNKSLTPLGNSTSDKTTWIMSTNGTVLVDLDREKVVEVQVPQYSLTHSRNNAVHCATGNQYVTFGNQYGTPVAVMLYQADGPNVTKYIDGQLMRAGADDCNFGCFVSIPPMVYTGS